MVGRIAGKRRRGWQRMRWLDGHHWLNGHESEQTPGDGEGQGSLVCCSPWGRKGSDTTERLNNTQDIQTSLVAQAVKNLPAMQETWVWSLGQEDTLEKGMASHSSIVAWKIPWTNEPGQLQSTGCTESDTTEYKCTCIKDSCHLSIINDFLSLKKSKCCPLADWLIV